MQAGEPRIRPIWLLGGLAVVLLAVTAVAITRSHQGTRVLEDIQQRYGEATTLDIAWTSTSVYEVDGRPSPSTRTSGSLLLKKPDKFVVRWDAVESWCDGSTIVQYATLGKEFSREPLDDHLLRVITDGHRDTSRYVDTVGLAFGADYAGRLKSATVRLRKPGRRPMYQLVLEMTGPDSSQIRQTLLVDRKTLALIKSSCTIHGHTPVPKRPMPPGWSPEPTKHTITTVFKRCKMNGDISNDVFVFRPPAGSKPYKKRPAPLIGIQPR